MRARGDALLENPHEAVNRLEVTSHGRSFIPANLQDNAPILVSIHGGGYVAGRAAFDDAKNDELATRFGAIVLSPEYRLAPEFPFPIPVDDCISALAEALERFGYERPIFVLGDSAGAGLAYSMVSRLYGLAAQAPQDEETCQRTQARSLQMAQFGRVARHPVRGDTSLGLSSLRRKRERSRRFLTLWSNQHSPSHGNT